MQRGPRSKIVRVRRGFLGMGDRRRHQRTMNRMGRRGWRYVESVRRWSGTDLVFVKDGAADAHGSPRSTPPPPPPR